MNSMNVVNLKAAKPQAAADGRTLAQRAEAVSRIAAEFADAVDREARFPAEAMAAAKEHRLLGCMIPVELGGDGATLNDLMEQCFILGKACSSTAMIIAMHHVKVACILRHHGNNAWQLDNLRRIAAEQLLMGSSTTEGVAGGNVRSSAAAADVVDGKFTLVRDASVISYGAECDGVVTTARRSATSANSDQVLVVTMKPECQLEPTQGWDTLGMRGTRSIGFKLTAKGTADQILAEPYDRIHTQSMVPYAHLLWGSAWTGVAAGAVERSQKFLRKVAAASGGSMPPGSRHFALAKASLAKARALLTATGDMYSRLATDSKNLSSLDFQSAINGLKIEVSDLAAETVLAALRVNGLAGYRADGEFSVSRALRDVLSAPIMIHNDRIAQSMVNTHLMGPVATTLRP